MSNRIFLIAIAAAGIATIGVIVALAMNAP